MDLHILVDQFGYRPEDRKVAVIRTPEIGFDVSNTFAPGSIYEIRSADDDRVVLSRAITPWNHGKVQDSSGDRGWWFDFSALEKPGRYYVYDSAVKRRSAVFTIAADVYRDVLKSAVRFFFYQRSGFAKQAPFAEACWTDAAAYLGPGQDLEARDVSDPDNESKFRDVSGGWHDAGDTNKYVTFAAHAVHQLLSAYSEHPAAFTDDFNIPESGNGVPDVLDEVKWELQWLKRMQNADGSSALKVGTLKHADASPPSRDRLTRYYIPTCTASTIASAGMFAHAALVFRDSPRLAAEAGDLLARAVRGYRHYRSAETIETQCDRDYDGRKVLSGDADLDVQDQNALATLAALYLHALTGDANYLADLKAGYRNTQPFKSVGWTRYDAYLGQAFLQYAGLTAADPELKRIFLDGKRDDAKRGNQIYGENDDDLYRNFLHPDQYHWGSNAVRANYGGSNLDMVRLQLDPKNTPSYRARALDSLHYLHGVNPFGQVYLTNMYSSGASRCVDTTWHTWFYEGSRWSNTAISECGPAPGYLVGGPNVNVAKDGVPTQVSPPNGQPAQKSYLDSNSTEHRTWVISESSIVYQAPYIKLLAGFVP